MGDLEMMQKKMEIIEWRIVGVAENWGENENCVKKMGIMGANGEIREKQRTMG